MEKAFIDQTRIRAEYGGLEGKGTGVVATGGAAKPLPQIILRRRSEPARAVMHASAELGTRAVAGGFLVDDAGSSAS